MTTIDLPSYFLIEKDDLVSFTASFHQKIWGYQVIGIVQSKHWLQNEVKHFEYQFEVFEFMHLDGTLEITVLRTKWKRIL